MQSNTSKGAEDTEEHESGVALLYLEEDGLPLPVALHLVAAQGSRIKDADAAARKALRGVVLHAA